MIMKIHGIDKRQAIGRIKELFKIAGNSSRVGNYPAIALPTNDRRYIVMREGQLQVADLNSDSPNFNREPFKNYAFLSDLDDSDLEKFMLRIAEDVKDYKGIVADINAAERRALQEMFPFSPDLEDEDLESEETNRPFLPRVDE